MFLQNPRMLRVCLDGQVLARQGAMAAYQGAVDFAYQGAGSVGRFMKRAFTSEGLPLMRVSGRGDVYLARDACEIHLIDLRGDSVTVSGENVLAFDASLDWNIHRVSGAGMMAGGLFGMVISGYGRLAVACYGTPVALPVRAGQPVFVDTSAAVAWSTHLNTTVNSTVKLGSLIGRGSGEAFQLALDGDGFALVQPSEGPPAAAGSSS
ncbi:AIM24 family protein [Lipingzhangella sp. LS1_29]|uniref:AIM24 family protein n=1 Tax=Lipingzhangella rawalii TaxID=2055835 RepID=A0ABU2H4F8_9ACTN|nr:AIM24 family protein [Lipingzhangella rawalii]MDS1270194.1 AIM24 family protein [Lipingzhangella rawalii]